MKPLDSEHLLWLLQQPETWRDREAVAVTANGGEAQELEPRDRLAATAAAIGAGFRAAMAESGRDSPVGDEVHFRHPVSGETLWAAILGLSGRLYVWDAKLNAVVRL